MELKDYCLEIEKFLKDYLVTAHSNGFVLGVSGGVDSSLVLALAKHAVGKDKLLCLLLPIESNPKDLEDGISLCKEFGVNYKVIDLTNTYHSFVKECGAESFTRLTLSNLKVRMRMCTLYMFGQQNNYLVLGTDNMDERYVGYFTKYGDGAADVLPIVHLTKEEVRNASQIYGVNEYLANRIPTAGLFEGQTDEREMGITYNDLDAFLLGKEIPEEVKNKIEHLHKVSEHKRAEIPTPEKFNRD